MNKKEIRKRFADFVGPEKMDRFMKQLHHKPKCKTELLYWQEVLWERFLDEQELAPMTHHQILDLFFYCHRHNRDLNPGAPECPEGPPESASYFYKQAYQRVEDKYFPMHWLEGFYCPDCVQEKQDFSKKTHQDEFQLDTYEKHVCDMEEECMEIYEQLGDIGVGRLEGLSLYYLKHRMENNPKMDQAARWLMNSADLFIEDDPFEILREFLKTPGEKGDLEEFFEINPKLYFALKEMEKELFSQ